MSDKYTGHGRQQLRTYISNEAIATYYYPSAAGLDVRGREALAVQLACAGGATVTVEATMARAELGETVGWADITASMVNMATNTTGHVSYANPATMLLLPALRVERIRIKNVRAGIGASLVTAII